MGVKIANRWWEITHQDSFCKEWESDKGDVVQSFFGMYPIVNGVLMSNKGATVGEILTSNAVMIKARNLLNE